MCLSSATRTVTLPYFRHILIIVAGPTVWNSLPESVRSAETLSSFKRKLKTYLFNISF